MYLKEYSNIGGLVPPFYFRKVDNMSQEELNEIEKRIYELRDLAILALKEKKYDKFANYYIELKDIEKKLNKVKKECEKC